MTWYKKKPLNMGEAASLRAIINHLVEYQKQHYGLLKEPTQLAQDVRMMFFDWLGLDYALMMKGDNILKISAVWQKHERDSEIN